MEQKVYFLVTEWKEFYDGHGEPDYGGTTKFISDDFKKYGDFEEGQDYNDYGQEYKYETEDEDEDGDDDPEFRAEDGYNCEVTWTSVKRISEEESVRIGKVIEEYNNL